jgi:hypothetical protein
VLPTFLGIGAQRAGTTWAFECLAEHPDIYVPQEKELHFFYVNYGRGLTWYKSQFADAGDKQARGEISPDYMYHEAALRNISRDLPDIKLFVILRNPIERAYSQYLLHRHRFADKPFDAVCEPGTELFDRGLYHHHLSRVFSIFPREQVKVLIYDDLAAHPAEFLSELYSFLGVDAAFRPSSLVKTYNRVIYPGAQKALISLRLGWLIDSIKATAAGDFIRRRHSSQGSAVATAANLGHLAKLYEEDVNSLSRMLKRDLTHWV